MNERDKKRFFTKEEKEALFLAADGKSEMSGEPLNEDWQADHVLPWSKGGPTNVDNGQAVTRAENMSKSDKILTMSRVVFTPRAWQSRFFEDYVRTEHATYLLAALPGGGKTPASLQVARWFLNDFSRKLIVVVPTRPLKKQWRKAAFEIFGIRLKSEEFFGSLNDDYEGAVVTYAAVARSPQLFRRICTKFECMVIFDEIHHAADESSWGDNIKDAFENAKKKLCLTGTPFRSDHTKIPFLQIEGDGYHTNFKYDYPTALEDEVVRYVSFHRYGGDVTVAKGDIISEFSTDDVLDESEAAIRLRSLLKARTFTRDLLARAHEKLLEVREFKPNAGGLALCMNQAHAEFVARLLEEITGERPDIVVSDEDRCSGDIDSFRDSKRKWIVAVRMISEGVDIKRLMVLAFLTNTVTPLFFRQAIGRIVRREGEDYDSEAYCYMPDDSRLSAIAADIEKMQAEVLKKDDRPPPPGPGGDDGPDWPPPPPPLPEEVLGSSAAELKGTIGRGQYYSLEQAKEIIALAKEFQVAEVKMAAIVARLRQTQPLAETQVEQAIHPEDQQKRLRDECSRLASRVAYAMGIEHKAVHAEYKRLTGLSQHEMTIEQLKVKRQWLLKRLSEAKPR